MPPRVDGPLAAATALANRTREVVADTASTAVAALAANASEAEAAGLSPGRGLGRLGGMPVGGGDQKGMRGASGDTMRGDPPSGAVIIIFLGGLVLSQLLLQAWKKRHARSYNQVTLAGLWLIPAGLSVHAGYARFVGVWVIFSLVTAAYVYKATRKPLAPRTPRQVYSWFSRVYKVNYAIGVAGYVAAVVQGMTGPLSRFIMEWSILAVFYGLYFGVLGRDIAEVCAERMSTTLGYCNKKDDDRQAQRPPANICCLCGDNLRPGGPHVADPRASEVGAEPLFELPCSHTFHEQCILGWTIVGKKDTCPFCSEKVTLASVAGTSAWRKQSVAWSWLLDMVRYLLSWHPIFLMVLHLVFLEAGLTH